LSSSALPVFFLEFWRAPAETSYFGIINLAGEKENSMLLRALSLVMLASLLLAIAPGLAVGQDTAKLINPAQLNETAPDKFQAKFETSKGEFIVDVTRSWAPNGADRFYNLVKNGYYDNCRFFRVIQGFMVQFGINGDPKLNRVWRSSTIKDDPVKQSNMRGYITFATSGLNSRTTQVFINFSDRNAALDKDGFAPFGKVSKGMDVVDSLYNGYGEGAPSGAGPDQNRTQAEGNAYLEKSFPKLDYIKSATIVPAK
jgi:peptidyl-prolyl cis-trans isomerase A (cyclophilin A)